MFYKIIGSGSNGNCILVYDVLIECGVSFKKKSKMNLGKKFMM